MPRIEIKHIHRVTKRLADGTSHEYHYAWRGGPRFWSSRHDAFKKNGPEYFAAYAKACEDRKPSAGTFRQVIGQYLESRDFRNLAPRTQKDYQRSIYMKGGIDEEFGTAPIGVFNRPEIRQIAYRWRDRFSSARVADHARTHLVKIVNWAVDRSIITTNHLAGMTALYEVDRSDLIWTDTEIEAFCDGAPDYLRRILIAATETGLRPQDLCILSRAHIQQTPEGRRIVIRTQKRRRMVSIPVTPVMGKIIDETPRDRLIILVGDRGQPYSKASSMGRQVTRRKAEINEAARKGGFPIPIREELHFYDCRGTAATRLFQADATLREIAAHMGWSIQTAAKMIEVYVSMNPQASDAVLVKLSAARLN
ncbi:tyrosine-type recombinase/integrase [Rhodobacter lacus]|uniref:Tyrosine-type recombinase/integrase n=1 Tax=Rhodobacter lacus TaxID=1641972 RepID=A0ABW5ABH3_9RHOB